MIGDQRIRPTVVGISYLTILHVSAHCSRSRVGATASVAEAHIVAVGVEPNEWFMVPHPANTTPAHAPSELPRSSPARTSTAAAPRAVGTHHELSQLML
jgi:hypothetical protein